jgi:hypothetical protein
MFSIADLKELIQISLLVSIELHIIDVEATRVLRLMECGVCIPPDEQKVLLTKV